MDQEFQMNLGRQIDFPAFNFKACNTKDYINNVSSAIYGKIRDDIEDPVFDILFSQIEAMIIDTYETR